MGNRRPFIVSRSYDFVGLSHRDSQHACQLDCLRRRLAKVTRVLVFISRFMLTLDDSNRAKLFAVLESRQNPIHVLVDMVCVVDNDATLKDNIRIVGFVTHLEHYSLSWHFDQLSYSVDMMSNVLIVTLEEAQMA